MRRSVFAMLLLLGVPFVSGCAQMVKVTFYSDPPLATIYQGSQRMGVTPVTLQYRLTKDDLERGDATFQGASARWVSGATAEISRLDINLSIGRDQQYTFFRPQSYPGLDIDVQYASNFRRDLMNLAVPLLLEQQQQEALQPRRPIVPPVNTPPTYNTNCTSDAYGNTNCTTRRY